ncbi:kinase-like domain-containing protein [Achaetomium macrosporum]|uniref:Kinase-like domain-containing protein n=1 Tax=Achaetomium macrosporum TaxID=79813 RepID=A0AAN7CAE2_9PEZI|nr:kinase-like domain-containing protein [Achaetomium macrosporum]
MPVYQPWPPVLPDLDSAKIELELPALSISPNSEIYLVKGCASQVFKAKAMLREYELQKAAGDCAMPVRGKVLFKPAYKNREGHIYFHGFMMDRAAPIQPDTLSPSQRRDLMHLMIHIVHRLHNDKRIIHGDMKLQNMLVDNQGKLRLCDFAEARYVDEDKSLWEGICTWHYQSPNRRVRVEQLGYYPPPPTIEDDLFGLGLSIREMYRETVDVAQVDDPEAREIITGFLRQGGARV